MDASVSVVVPTIGRPTLAATLEALVPQIGPRDEVIVVADSDDDRGDVQQARRIFDDHGDCRPGWRFLRCPSSGPRDVGYSQRNLGISLATGTHLAFVDDDDVYTPDALARFRAAADPAVPVIFCMDHPSLGILWRDRVLRYGNIGTPMLLVPNVAQKLAGWREHLPGEGGDFAFVSGCVERMGDPIWRDEVVAVVRPHERVIDPCG